MIKRLRLGLLIGAGLMLDSCVEPSPPPRPIPAPPPVPVARPVDIVDPNAFAFRGSMVQGGLLRGIAPAGATALRLDGKPVELAAGGRFLIGFGRDAGQRSELEADTRDGRTIRAVLPIGPRTWDIQSLPNLPRGTKPSPEFLARRKIELARINAARKIRSDAQGWQQPFLWPVTGRISGVFGSQRIYAGEPGSPHSGVDIARPSGTPIVTPADGVITLVAQTPFTLEGYLLMVDHGMGLNSAFLHLSRIEVVEGQKVARGDRIGAIGTTGRSTGPHLHWGMKWQDVRVDPQLLAGPMP